MKQKALPEQNTKLWEGSYLSGVFYFVLAFRFAVGFVEGF